MTLKTKRKIDDKWYGLFEFNRGEQYHGNVRYWWTDGGWSLDDAIAKFNSMIITPLGRYLLPLEGKRWAIIEMKEEENEFGVISP